MMMRKIKGQQAIRNELPIEVTQINKSGCWFLFLNNFKHYT